MTPRLSSKDSNTPGTGWESCQLPLLQCSAQQSGQRVADRLQAQVLASAGRIIYVEKRQLPTLLTWRGKKCDLPSAPIMLDSN